ncbi:MAG: tetratricopeptide repeat protein [Candidatus Brocadiia bacterium]|nr:tetratricopeptide repeat protein [Candidatus Brocadiia bacterium]
MRRRIPADSVLKGAFEKAQEALEIYRELAGKHPEAFLPDVAMTLNNLGAVLSKLGDRKGASGCLPSECRSAYRSRLNPTHTGNTYGFRVVVSPRP